MRYRLPFIAILFVSGLYACSHSSQRKGLGPSISRQPSQLKELSSCRYFVKRFLSANYSVFEGPTRLKLKALANNFQYLGIEWLRNRKDLEIVYLFNHLPKELQDYYLAAPTPSGRAMLYLESMSEAYAEAHKGLLRDLHSTFRTLIRDHYGEPAFSLGTWIQARQRRLAEMAPSERQTLRESLEQLFQQKKFRDLYQSGFYVQLELIKRDKETFLRVANKEYPAELRQGRIFVLVPKQEVSPRGDNPLDTQHLIRLSQGGERPDSYLASPNLNGSFYLDDGNHRFAVLENREEVWLELDSLKTTGMHQYLAMSNRPSPTLEEIQDLAEGRLSPVEYLRQLGIHTPFKDDDFVRENSLEILPLR